MLRCIPLTLCLLICLGLRAKSGATPDSTDPYSVQALIPRLQEGATIDGRLNEDVWNSAFVISGLRQVEPATGEPGSEFTRVLVYYTQTTLYIGIDAQDKAPSEIIGRHLKRDSSMVGDDYIAITLDPLNDKRTGYIFQINPRGACTDGVIISGKKVNNDWNGIWFARTRISETGWTAEIAIPFATLSFKADGNAWGFNIERYLSRKNEMQRWCSPTRNTYIQQMGSAGEVLGLKKLKHGKGIDFIPYAKGEWRHSKTSGQKTETLAGDAGFDLFYKFMTTASVAITVNTDFSSTEIDDRVINLTRFPVRLPEKREFFLRGCEIFDFGGINTAPSPFFSRRMGLDDHGQPVDIQAGIKSSGRIGHITYGLIDVETRNDDGQRRNLGVFRAQTDLFDESSAGFIFTRGDPNGKQDVWLGGADMNYRTSKWRGEGYMQLSGYAMTAQNQENSGSGSAYGINYEAKSDRVAFEGILSRIDDDFAPPLGFVRQTGIYNMSGEMRLRWRPRYANDIDWVVAANHTMDLDGKLDYFEACLTDLSMTNLDLNNFGFSWNVFRECVLDTFTVGKDAIILPGTYDTSRVSIWFNTRTSRPTRLTSNISYGGFYDGTSTVGTVSVVNQSLSWLHTTLACSETLVHTPRQNFNITSGSLRADVLFTPALALMLVGQWDNMSENFGLNLRLRWTVTPGRDLYIVLNQHARTTTGWAPVATDVTAKINWTFRF